MSRHNLALPRRVFMTADVVGGWWNYALGIAQGLASRGVEIDLAVIGPHPGAEQLRAAEGIENLFVVSTGLLVDWAAASEVEIADADLERFAGTL